MACSILTTYVLQAQVETTQVGKVAFSAGIGTVPTYVGGAAQIHVPATSLRASVQLSERFSLGTFFGYTDLTSAPRSFYDGYKTVVNNKTLMFGLRSDLRKEIAKKVDLYGGFTIGITSFKRTEKDATTGALMKRDEESPSPYNPNAPNSSLLYAGHVGAIYYFHNNAGAFMEAGYGISLFTLGMTFKLF